MRYLEVLAYDSGFELPGRIWGASICCRIGQDISGNMGINMCGYLCCGGRNAVRHCRGKPRTMKGVTQRKPKLAPKFADQKY